MKIINIVLLAAALLAFAACGSENKAKPEEKTAEQTAPAPEEKPAVLPGPSQAPEKFIVEVSEKGDIKVMGEPIKFDEFQTTVARYLLSYKMGGATKMPPMEFKLDGTVGMGTRQELETLYREAVEKIEASK